MLFSRLKCRRESDKAQRAICCVDFAVLRCLIESDKARKVTCQDPQREIYAEWCMGS